MTISEAPHQTDHASDAKTDQLRTLSRLYLVSLVLMWPRRGYYVSEQPNATGNAIWGQTRSMSIPSR